MGGGGGGREEGGDGGGTESKGLLEGSPLRKQQAKQGYGCQRASTCREGKDIKVCSPSNGVATAGSAVGNGVGGFLSKMGNA